MMFRNALILLALAGAVAAGALIAVMQVRAADPAGEAERAPAPESAPESEPEPAPASPQEAEPAVITLPDAAPGPALASPRRTAPPAPGAGLIVPVSGVTPADLREDWGDPRSGGRSHQGLDIPAERGAPVLAADSGEILKFFDSERGGVTIYQADSSGRRVLYYAHRQRRARGLAEGQAVSAGQVIGYVGSTGNAAEDNPHLHFEVNRAPAEGGWYGGDPLNPYPLLAGG